MMKMQHSGTNKTQDSVVAEMISAIDNPEYPRVAMRALNRLVQADATAMYIYSGDELVYILDDDISHLVDSRFVDSYRKTTYRLNPFYQHHRIGIESGTYTMGQLARSQSVRKPLAEFTGIEIDDAEEIGYRTHGFPKRCSELAIAVRLSPLQTVQIALYRSGYNAFQAHELSTLKGLNQTFGALYSRFWQHHQLAHVSDDNILQSALHGLSRGELSNREQEVLLLDLNGSDARQIANKLKISEETVKTHRKRAFIKLGLNTKSQLFQTILRRIINRRNVG
ncbi:hypothetical protein J3U99_09035 [Brucella pituitosa]|uniref:helix-turn-helix transcriptional regulator n=1 Tax=Brucella pituitosa TaxID=571256 RepID=UPI002002BA21|nr:LuxR C-terminal-related transcriptional regulator [Brucella pituitosa]MCK4204909.1 hypothetical protein [Brucella pituitosa]